MTVRLTAADLRGARRTLEKLARARLPHSAATREVGAVLADLIALEQVAMARGGVLVLEEASR